MAMAGTAANASWRSWLLENVDRRQISHICVNELGGRAGDDDRGEGRPVAPSVDVSLIWQQAVIVSSGDGVAGAAGRW